MKDQLLLLLILLLEHLELLPDRVEAVLDALSSGSSLERRSPALASQAGKWALGVSMIVDRIDVYGAAHQFGGELIFLLLRLSKDGLSLAAVEFRLLLDGIASEECGWFALGFFFLLLRIAR